jgi:hypothetical protein
MNVCVLSANLGGFDVPIEHVKQTVKHDRIVFNDENFPPRRKAMTPRLQAKIPKCFGWQLAPGYDRYLWIDGNITMTNENTLKLFMEKCDDYDIAVLRHPGRTTIHWEGRYLERGLEQFSMYILGRYDGEYVRDQMKAVKDDTSYVDDLLVLGGVFMYKNTPEVHEVLKEWWYHITRYLIQDQLSWAYVLKKSGLNVNVTDISHTDGKYLSCRGHIAHSR